jgi:hypothetical protein
MRMHMRTVPNIRKANTPMTQIISASAKIPPLR